MNEIPNVADTQPEVTAETMPAATAEPCHLPPEGDNGGAGDTLDVKFNKQMYTLSREDATRYAQKGMKYDTVEPLLNSLREIADREGKTLTAWVEGLSGDSKTEEVGNDLAGRLAEQYLELRREVPGVGGFDTLPPEALREAAERGIPLLDAYLRHEHRQRCRVAAEQAAQSAAAAASTGTQATGGTADGSPVVSAMMRGLWGR